MQFAHDPFTIVTQPVQHSLCGPLSYTSAFDGEQIDQSVNPVDEPLVDPVGYNAFTRTHTVYSENFSLIGQHTYTVSAFLTDYPSLTSPTPDPSATINFIDPCPNPESLLATQQVDPDDYDYTGQAPSVKFTLNAFVVEPPVCDFQYSCQVISGDRLDLCQISDGSTQGVFDPISGNYEFFTEDMVNFKPGEYTFEITGTVGSQSTSATFVMTLVDPCLTTKLSIIEPDPFEDLTYTLRDP